MILKIEFSSSFRSFKSNRAHSDTNLKEPDISTLNHLTCIHLSRHFWTLIVILKQLNVFKGFDMTKNDFILLHSPNETSSNSQSLSNWDEMISVFKRSVKITEKWVRNVVIDNGLSSSSILSFFRFSLQTKHKINCTNVCYIFRETKKGFWFFFHRFESSFPIHKLQKLSEKEMITKKKKKTSRTALEHGEFRFFAERFGLENWWSNLFSILPCVML